VSMTTPFEVRERELAAADAELVAVRSAMQAAWTAWEAAKEQHRERVRLANWRYYKALEAAVAAERRADGNPGRLGDELEDCRVPNSDTARGIAGPGGPGHCRAFCLCAEHDRQLGGGSPLSSLMVAKD
jgi:hypothetical protein